MVFFFERCKASLPWLNKAANRSTTNFPFPRGNSYQLETWLRLPQFSFSSSQGQSQNGINRLSAAPFQDVVAFNASGDEKDVKEPQFRNFSSTELVDYLSSTHVKFNREEFQQFVLSAERRDLAQKQNLKQVKVGELRTVTLWSSPYFAGLTDSGGNVKKERSLARNGGISESHDVIFENLVRRCLTPQQESAVKKARRTSKLSKPIYETDVDVLLQSCEAFRKEHFIVDRQMVKALRLDKCYEVVSCAGVGAYGQVLEVKHKLDDKKYALKIVPLQKEESEARGQKHSHAHSNTKESATKLSRISEDGKTSRCHDTENRKTQACKEIEDDESMIFGNALILDNETELLKPKRKSKKQRTGSKINSALSKLRRDTAEKSTRPGRVSTTKQAQRNTNSTNSTYAARGNELAIREVKTMARVSSSNTAGSDHVVKYHSSWVVENINSPRSFFPASTKGREKEILLSDEKPRTRTASRTCPSCLVPEERDISDDVTISESLLPKRSSSDSVLVMKMELTEVASSDTTLEASGLTLRDWIRCKECRSSRACKTLALDIVKGLKCIHLNGVMHRDLKPENLLLYLDETKDLRVKICDFGMARFVKKNSIPAPLVLQPIMAKRNIKSRGPDELSSALGTMTYAAPEQLSSGCYDERVDIYSLGVILFELFNAPFMTEMERLRIFGDLKHGVIQVQDIELGLLTSITKKEKAMLQVVVFLCLHKEPRHRPSLDQIESVLKILLV